VEFFEWVVDVFRNLDWHLNLWTQELGLWVYAILFLIVFCETGLVVTPILPGDSLLFAVGAMTAIDGSPLHLGAVIALLIAAGILGDAVNYAIGARVGPKVFTSEKSRWWNRHHLERAHEFYEKHGGKTILLARFLPIIRTFAPFVAGIGKMGYTRFAVFNVTGAILWVFTFTLAGYWFGNLPVVKRHFQLVILGIIVVSLIPAVIELVRGRRRARAARERAAVPTRSPDAAQ
jgi:membrane-associated protein